MNGYRFKHRWAVLLCAALWLLAQPAAAQQSPDNTTWRYGTHHDEMRNFDFAYARLMSLTSAQPAELPDLSIRAGIEIVNVGPQLDIGIMITGGKLECSMMTGCKITVRFDDGPVEMIDATRDSASSFVALSVKPGDHLARQVMQSHSMFIELPIEKAGLLQFKFDTSGFDTGKLGVIAPEKPVDSKLWKGKSAQEPYPGLFIMPPLKPAPQP